MLTFKQLKGLQDYFKSHPIATGQEEIAEIRQYIKKKLKRIECYCLILCYSPLLPLAIGIVTNNPLLMLPSAIIYGIGALCGLVVSADKTLNYLIKRNGINQKMNEVLDYLENPSNQRELLIEVNKLSQLQPNVVKEFKLALMKSDQNEAIQLFNRLREVLNTHSAYLFKEEKKKEEQQQLAQFEESLGLIEQEIEFNGNHDYRKII